MLFRSIPTAPQETSQRPPPLLANHNCSLISEINQRALSLFQVLRMMQGLQMTRQRHCPPEMCNYTEETDKETQRQSPGVLGRRGAEALSCPPGEGRGPRQPPTLSPPRQWRSYLASFSHSEAAPQEKHDPPGHFLLGHLPVQQWGWIEWSFPF